MCIIIPLIRASSQTDCEVAWSPASPHTDYTNRMFVRIHNKYTSSVLADCGVRVVRGTNGTRTLQRLFVHTVAKKICSTGHLFFSLVDNIVCE
ncbi:unnamed protein product [Spodoptera exigua]|nr:unnamed protein product [Spodoptera exigua]